MSANNNKRARNDGETTPPARITKAKNGLAGVPGAEAIQALQFENGVIDILVRDNNKNCILKRYKMKDMFLHIYREIPLPTPAPMST